ncbi:hypothetical protein ACHAXA_005150 [Cyclostephanos tholiformis]|uniref:Uncharacterized protein n=1 Tax=Cyclostephanos tholiformis TaxID=382380 RepID=A0ABD3R4C9_9STRA
MRTGCRVDFAETSRVAVVTNLSAGPYKNSLWFSKDEMELFKTNVAIRINRLRRCVLENDFPPVSYIVGLEKFLTSELTAEYTARRDKLIREILVEARLGCTNDAESSERLMRISTDNSKWAKEQAQLAARFLERYHEIECTGQNHIEPTNSSFQESRQQGSSQVDVSISSPQFQPRLRSFHREKKRSRLNPPTTIKSLPEMTQEGYLSALG